MRSILSIIAIFIVSSMAYADNSCVQLLNDFLNYKNFGDANGAGRPEIYVELLDGITDRVDRKLTKYKRVIYELSKDPAHGGEYSHRGMIEVLAAIKAYKEGKIKTPITRGPVGQIDFYDGLGIAWDVKTPVSPLSGEHWVFNVDQVGKSILEQINVLYTDISSKRLKYVRVLLDISYLSDEHYHVLITWLKENLGPEELLRIKIVNIFS